MLNLLRSSTHLPLTLMITSLDIGKAKILLENKQGNTFP